VCSLAEKYALAIRHETSPRHPARRKLETLQTHYVTPVGQILPNLFHSHRQICVTFHAIRKLAYAPPTDEIRPSHPPIRFHSIPIPPQWGQKDFHQCPPLASAARSTPNAPAAPPSTDVFV
jgi:hypothetical protein